MFYQRVKNIQWRKDSLFDRWCWENWSATCKRMKLEHSLTAYTRINSKWVKDLNVRLGTTKLLEEHLGRTLFDVNHSKIFFDPPPRVMEIKTKINKRHLFNKLCWENWSATCKRMKLDHFITPRYKINNKYNTKINSKWIKDLKCKT